jgi:hypothetical protein
MYEYSKLQSKTTTEHDTARDKTKLKYGDYVTEKRIKNKFLKCHLTYVLIAKHKIQFCLHRILFSGLI